MYGAKKSKERGDGGGGGGGENPWGTMFYQTSSKTVAAVLVNLSFSIISHTSGAKILFFAIRTNTEIIRNQKLYVRNKGASV